MHPDAHAVSGSAYLRVVLGDFTARVKGLIGTLDIAPQQEIDSAVALGFEIALALQTFRFLSCGMRQGGGSPDVTIFTNLADVMAHHRAVFELLKLTSTDAAPTSAVVNLSSSIVAVLATLLEELLAFPFDAEADPVSEAALTGYREDLVRYLSDFLMKLANHLESSPPRSGSRAGTPRGYAPQRQSSIEDDVPGHRMTCVVRMLWVLLKDHATQQSTQGRSPGEAAPFFTRRYEKLFHERSLGFYMRMLIAVLKQQPAVAVRVEHNVDDTDSVDPVVLRRMTVGMCFGVCCALASDLFQQFCTMFLSPDDAWVGALRDVFSKRVLREGLDCVSEFKERLSVSGALDLHATSVREWSDVLSRGAFDTALLLAPQVAGFLSLCSDRDLKTVQETCHLAEDCNYAMERSCWGQRDALGNEKVQSKQFALRLWYTTHWALAQYLSLRADENTCRMAFNEFSEKLGGFGLPSPSPVPRVSLRRSPQRTTVSASQSTFDPCDDDGIDDLRTRGSMRASTGHPLLSSETSAKSHAMRDAAHSLESTARMLLRRSDEYDLLAASLEAAQRRAAAAEQRCTQQESELGSVKATLAQVRQQLLDESALHAEQSAAAAEEIRKQNDAIQVHQNRVRVLERQLKRFEQMNAVIRSMTNELSTTIAATDDIDDVEDKSASPAK